MAAKHLSSWILHITVLALKKWAGNNNNKKT